jgi:hypothetical protein
VADTEINFDAPAILQKRPSLINSTETALFD